MTRPDVHTHGPETSNSILLSGREWLVVAAVTVALVALLPRWWARAEKFEPQPDERMSYELSNDYWLYERWAAKAAAQDGVILFGDSVIWGQFVPRNETLSHWLNELAGRERFANLGLDGSHPVALAGLIEYYGAAIENQEVVLHCNPLWLSSLKHDLRVEDEFRFNHPQLVPQFSPWISCYREEISRRLGTVVNRNSNFCAWSSHLQLAYYDKMDIPAWTMEHPYQNPFSAITFTLPRADKPCDDQRTWAQRGIARQDFEWVDLDFSLQWRQWQHAISVLQERGNRVFVLIGPFNENLLTDKGREGYGKIKEGMQRWLRGQNIPFCAPDALPSALYADASHPLGEGYRTLAKQLWESFRAAGFAQ